MKVYNKLVRDNVPELIIADGFTPAFRILTHEEYEAALKIKLQEEVNEFKFDGDYKELFDVLEVAEAMLRAHGYSAGEILEAKAKKAAIKGRFKERIFLESIAEEE